LEYMFTKNVKEKNILKNLNDVYSQYLHVLL